MQPQHQQQLPVQQNAASTNSHICQSHTPTIMAAIRRLIYWRVPWKTGLLLAMLLAAEFSLLICSVISVFSWSGLGILAYSAAFKLFTYVRAYIRGTSQDSSTKSGNADEDEDDIEELDDDCCLLEGEHLKQRTSMHKEEVEETIRKFLDNVNFIFLSTRDLFLIKSTVDSVKFAIFLYVMTYVGARFNFLTLFILATLSVFSIPKIYELYKTEIDGILKEIKKNFDGFYHHFYNKLSQMPVLKDMLATKKTTTAPKLKPRINKGE